MEQAARFITFLTTGSSTPIVVETAVGKRFLVKLQGGQSGRYAYLCEWLGGRIGEAIGLPINRPEAIGINENLEIGRIHEEVKDLIHKSFGVNLAFSYYENARSCKPDHAQATYVREAAELFLFDVFMLNTDRSARNPNLMEVDGRLRSFDYETSFLLMGIAQDRDFHEAAFVLQSLRENPICHAVFEDGMVDDLFFKLKQLDFQSIVNSIPAEWLADFEQENPEFRANLTRGLIEAADNRARFEATLGRVHHVTPEDEEAKRRRRTENLARFKAGIIPIEILGPDGKPLP